MSWDINHVVIVGRLTRDPDLSYTQSGSAVCRFSVAVNRSSGPAAEGQEDTTSFFNVVAWNKTAELCKEYLSKGKQVGIDAAAAAAVVGHGRGETELGRDRGEQRPILRAPDRQDRRKAVSGRQQIPEPREAGTPRVPGGREPSG